MFVLKRPFYAYFLYKFGRRLGGFGLQPLLDGLPVPFLTGFSRRKKAAPLPEDIKERLRLFLEKNGIAERMLSLYLGLYPEITGEGRADILLGAVRGQDSFPSGILRQDERLCSRLIELFFALSFDGKISVRPAADFERFAGTLSDFRLEAAVLEELNDSFYEEEHIGFSLPVWEETSEHLLKLQEKRGLTVLEKSPDREKTARSLSSAVTTMILRDGLVVLPSLANCRADEQGGIFFTRVFPYLSLNPENQRTLELFIKALKMNNVLPLLDFLKAQGCDVPDSDAVSSLQEEFSRRAPELSQAEQMIFLTQRLIQAGVCVPFFLRFIAYTLKETKRLCEVVLKTPVKDLFSQSGIVQPPLYPRKKPFSVSQEDSARVFSFEKNQMERLKLQNKKPPSFQTDKKKIRDILLKQSAAVKIKRRFPLTRTQLFLIVLFFLLMRFFFGK